MSGADWDGNDDVISEGDVSPRGEPVEPTPSLPTRVPRTRASAHIDAADDDEGAFSPPTQEDRTMAILAHVLGLVVGLFGPLVIWLIGKDKSPFVNHHGREALNFQLTVLIVTFASVVILSCIPFVGLLALPVPIAALGCDLVFSIIAAVAASNGERYRYPICFRMVK